LISLGLVVTRLGLLIAGARTPGVIVTVLGSIGLIRYTVGGAAGAVGGSLADGDPLAAFLTERRGFSWR
jgi:hypothetical protein